MSRPRHGPASENLHNCGLMDPLACRECAIGRPTRSAASSLSARRSDGHLRRSSSPALRPVSRCRLWSVQPSPRTRDRLRPNTTRRLLRTAVRSSFESPCAPAAPDNVGRFTDHESTRSELPLPSIQLKQRPPTNMAPRWSQRPRRRRSRLPGRLPSRGSRLPIALAWCLQSAVRHCGFTCGGLVKHRRSFLAGPMQPITSDGNYSLRFPFSRLRSCFSCRLRCCSSSRALSLSLALSTVLSHSSLSSKQYVWQPALSSGGSVWQLAVQAISLLEQSN